MLSGTTTVATLPAGPDGYEYHIEALGGVTADAAGDLFGVSGLSGPDGIGAIYEVPAGSGGTARTLHSFTVADVSGGDSAGGGSLDGGLLVDPAGDLFGTLGYQNEAGAAGAAVYELPAGASALTVLATLPGRVPVGRLVADAAGDLFGTTTATTSDQLGRAFEVVAGTHAVRDLSDLGGDTSPLAIAADGDLYGIVETQQPSTDGSSAPGQSQVVFRLPADGGAYDQAPVTLAHYTFDDDVAPDLDGPPVLDAAGDLFGTEGGRSVFEVPAGTDAARTIATPLSPEDPNRTLPPLTADAAGDLFGITQAPPYSGDLHGVTGPVELYELPAGTRGYTPLTDESTPLGTAANGPLLLTADGTLYGTTDGSGAGDTAAVYKVTGASITPTPTPSPTPTAATPAFSSSTVAATAVAGRASAGTVRLTLSNDTSAASRGSALVRVYAVPDGDTSADPIPSTGTLVGSARHRTAADAGDAVSLAVHVRLPATLAAGSYTLLVRSVDPAGAVSTAAGPPLFVALPTVDLSVIGLSVTPATLAARAPAVVTVTVTNVGTVTATGPVHLSVGLTTGGTVVAFPLGATRRRLTLPVGAYANLRLRVRVPASAATAAGRYDVLAVLSRKGATSYTSGFGDVTIT